MALKLSMLAVGCGAAAGFMAPMHNVLAKPANLRSAYQSRAPLRKLCMLDVPRVELPSAVTDVLKEQNLKNPNKMTTAEYNSYSAAAVGGTLVFMLLLGPVTGIFDIGGAIFDFVFSALLGGGALAYASLRKDEVAEYANKFGNGLMDGAGKAGIKDLPRISLPSAVTDVLKEQELKNPNDLSNADYNSYSAAAVGGTLIFMVLLGPVTGIFDLGGVVGDFVFSALIGGGTLAYAALRKDEASEYANKFGNLLLETADKVAEAVPK